MSVTVDRTPPILVGAIFKSYNTHWLCSDESKCHAVAHGSLLSTNVSAGSH